MKHLKTLLLMGLMGLCVQAWAQPSQGSWLIGGTAGFNSSKVGEFNATIINFSPLAGYFFADQVAAGAQLSVNAFGGDLDGTSFGIGPFVRFYFNNSGDARFFGQGSIAFSSIDPGDNADSYTNFGWQVGPGMDFFLNQNVALEVFLGFGQDKNEDAEESTTNIGLNIGVAAFIGN
jgi:hypothetical protein